jgi:hypothetical protein
MTKRILRNFVVASCLVGVALGSIACPEKGPAEKAGEKIDDAVDKAKEASVISFRCARESSAPRQSSRRGPGSEALEVARRFMELHQIHWPEFECESEVRPIEELA